MTDQGTTRVKVLVCRIMDPEGKIARRMANLNHEKLPPAQSTDIHTNIYPPLNLGFRVRVPYHFNLPGTGPDSQGHVPAKREGRGSGMVGMKRNPSADNPAFLLISFEGVTHGYGYYEEEYSAGTVCTGPKQRCVLVLSCISHNNVNYQLDILSLSQASVTRTPS